jgi:hypothetical protein
MGRAGRALSTPRFLLGLVAVWFGITALASWAYPPDYLTLPFAWGALAAVASGTAMAAAISPGRKRVAVAGATSICAAFARAVAIMVQVTWHPPPYPQSVSFWLAAVTWFGVAVLLHALWNHVVLPWAALLRVR